jgi:peroxiredoxin
MANFVETPDWSKIPAPIDDGSADHLIGSAIAPVSLPTTNGSLVDLSRLHGVSVVYCYPRTGRPNEANPAGWDEIPGARGCTPQSCAFRDHFQELTSLGAAYIFGLSTQNTDWQREAVERLHLPFSILSDENLAFTKTMRLPTFEKDGRTLLKRLTLIIRDGRVEHIFYPVFPPDRNAADVVEWLRSRQGKN